MSGWRKAWVLAALAAALSCAQAQEQEAEELGTPAEQVFEMQQQVEVEALDRAPEFERGMASWYGPRFHGRRTANGEVFDMHALTAAHPKLPFGSVVRVLNLETGRSVDVRINDRGPYIRRRVIDLSRAAAKALGLLDAGAGVKQVALKLLDSAQALRRP